MRNGKDYYVTYTTFDNKTRRIKGRLLSDDEKVIDKITEFVKTKKWPEEPFDDTVMHTMWGLALYPTMGARSYEKQRQFPNKTQYLYYRVILRCDVVGKIASECCHDNDFGKALLREAAIRAIKKDEERVINLLASGYKKENINPNAYQDALNRAKKRIRYHQTKPGVYHDEFSDFCRVIEEFELFTVREIKLCENRSKIGKKVS